MFLNTDFSSRDLLGKAINRAVVLQSVTLVQSPVPAVCGTWTPAENQSISSKALALTEQRKGTEHAVLCMRLSDK